jgi:flagellar hook-associated protein 3 FlgL
MRVTTRMLHRSALSELQGVWGRMQKLQSQIASGRRIDKPSDDPSGTDRAMKARSDTRINNQYIRTLEESRRFVETSETALSQLVNISTDINTLAVQVADDSYGPTTMASLAEGLNALLEESVSIANTDSAGTRIFGGQATRSDPFTTTRDENGRIISVGSGARGTEENLQRQVNEHLLLTINLTGSDLFGEDLEFFSDLIKLRDAASASDQEGARKLLSSLTDDLDRINLSQAVTGSLYNRIDGMVTWTEGQNLELEAVRSEYEDLDMVEAMMNYQNEQAVLQAALSTTGSMLQLSLVNYIR